MQISHTDGEVLTGPGFFQRCTSNASDDKVQECLASCNDLDDPKDRGPCRDKCGSVTTCVPACNPAVASMSFVRWGAGALSESGYVTCDESTCPVCAPPSVMRSLTNELLAIPTYRKEIWNAPPPAPPWIVECRYNHWRFEFDGFSSVAPDSSPYGISFQMAGTTGSPSVICDNAPDIHIEDLSLRLTFRFPWFGPQWVIAEGELEGDLTGILDDQIKSKVREIATNRLNKPDHHALYLSMFRKLVVRYIEQTRVEPVDIVGKIQTDYGGLHVQYWVK